MFPNPKPAVDAVGNSGPLPRFLFSNPFVAGFFSMLALPLFGAAATGFFGAFNDYSVLDLARTGAFLAVGLGVIIHVAILISAIFLREERIVRVQFAVGGTLGLAVLIGVDTVFWEFLDRHFIG